MFPQYAYDTDVLAAPTAALTSVLAYCRVAYGGRYHRASHVPPALVVARRPTLDM
jgi:hypothetical protein